MTAPKSTRVQAVLGRKDDGEPMPLEVLTYGARFAKTLATLAALKHGADIYDPTITGIRYSGSPFKADLHNPPKAAPDAARPAHGTRWKHGAHRAEVHYTVALHQTEGMMDWPHGIRPALLEAGLLDTDVLVVYSRPGKPWPEGWMPLGRWCQTYGTSPVKSRVRE